MPDPSRDDHPIHELEAALVRWRALLLIGDLQRRAYLQQLQPEPPGEGERLYRRLALRLADENQQLRARVAELEASRGDPVTHTDDEAPRASLGSNGTNPGRRVNFNCPGCGDFHNVIVDAPSGWGWNGDLIRPTFTPSVLVRYGVVAGQDRRCHSFVRDGRIEYLTDCTHDLAGQTVDLPPWRGYPWEDES